MKLNKIFLGLIAMLSVLLTACSDDDYKWATASGDQVYFSSELASTVELTKSAGVFNVQISRVKTDDEITVPITAQLADGSIFSVPSSVTFKAGENTADIHVTYDPEKVVYGSYEDITLAIGDDAYTTEYGYSTYSFKAGATEWLDITTNKSMGLMRDDAITTIFNFTEGAPTWDVQIQKSVISEGMYRIVEPYSQWYSEEAKASDNPFTYDESNAHTWVINATDPDAVYFGSCSTGMGYTGYGEMSLTSLVQYFLDNGKTLAEIKTAHPEYFGTLKDGIITMPTNSMAIAMVGLQDGNWLTANKNGLFAVALPGYSFSDYTIEATYSGRFTDTSDNDYANVSITLGSDIASVKYALVSSTSDVDATVQGIISGSVKSEEITASGNVQIAYTASGKYNLVMVGYDAAGEAVASSALSLKLTSSKETVEQFTEVASGIITLGTKDLSAIISQDHKPWGLVFGQTIEQEAVLSQSESDPTHMKIAPFVNPGSELEFTVDASGNIIVDGCDTGLSSQSTEIYVTDIVTFFGADSNNGAYLQQNGYGSAYDSENGLYTFNLLWHNETMDDYFGFEQETFEVLDELGAANFKAAVAKAKKAAEGRQYIVKATRTNKMKTFVKNGRGMQLVK